MNTNFKILNRIRFYRDKTGQISKAVMEAKMYLISLDQNLAQIELKRTKLDSEYEVRVDGHISNQRQYLENCARQVIEDRNALEAKMLKQRSFKNCYSLFKQWVNVTLRLKREVGHLSVNRIMSGIDYGYFKLGNEVLSFGPSNSKAAPRVKNDYQLLLDEFSSIDLEDWGQSRRLKDLATSGTKQDKVSGDKDKEIDPERDAANKLAQEAVKNLAEYYQVDQNKLELEQLELKISQHILEFKKLVASITDKQGQIQNGINDYHLCLDAKTEQTRLEQVPYIRTFLSEFRQQAEDLKDRLDFDNQALMACYCWHQLLRMRKSYKTSPDRFNKGTRYEDVGRYWKQRARGHWKRHLKSFGKILPMKD